MTKTKPLILITNDDGVSAPGIQALISVMADIGEIVVVAPDKPQSGMGHAITTNDTLYLNKISTDSDKIPVYSLFRKNTDMLKAG